MNFSYMMPTKVIFGNGCLRDNSSVFRSSGSKALIVTGGNSAKVNGSLKDVCSALDSEKISWDVFDRVVPNPPIDNVRDGAQMAKAIDADFIIGIGGGSPIDAAKAIALLATNEKTDEDLFVSPLEFRPLPVFAVPTTAGTGSEVTQYSILTDNTNKTKKNLSDDTLFPVAAFLDPSYMETLPWHTTVNTAVDALSHAVESYMSKRASTMSSHIALQALEILGEGIRSLDETKPVDQDIRALLLYGSMLGGMAIAQTGTTIVHAMGYSLTYFKNVDHGKANGLLMVEFLRFAMKKNKVKIDILLKRSGLNSIEALEQLLSGLLGRLQVLTEDEIKRFTEYSMSAKSVVTTVPEPTYEDVAAIYRNSVGENI